MGHIIDHGYKVLILRDIWGLFPYDVTNFDAPDMDSGHCRVIRMRLVQCTCIYLYIFVYISIYRVASLIVINAIRLYIIYGVSVSICIFISYICYVYI